MYTVTTPKNQEEFVELLNGLLVGVQMDGTADSEQNEEKIAKHLLQTDNDGADAELTATHIVSATFTLAHCAVELSKGSGRSIREFFTGTSAGKGHQRANFLLYDRDNDVFC